MKIFHYAKQHFALDAGWDSGICCQTRDSLGFVSWRPELYNFSLGIQQIEQGKFSGLSTQALTV